jgi:hypothetical protein
MRRTTYPSNVIRLASGPTVPPVIHFEPRNDGLSRCPVKLIPLAETP